MKTHDAASSPDSPADRIGELIKLAGRRPVPDAAQMADAHAAARLQWTRAVERRNWRIRLWWIATAALAVIAAGTVTWLGRQPSPVATTRPEIATLEAVTGPLVVVGGGTSHTVTAAGGRLCAGDRLDTAAGSRAAFRLPGGVSVRLDRDTSAVVDSESRLILQRGAAYVDAPPGSVRAALQIATPFGVVRHTGTQFEVRLDAAALQVRVREGAVAIDTPGERWTSGAGELLVLAHGRPHERRAISPSGPEWGWVSEVAPPFQLGGATVPVFLHWIAREHGWTLEFSDPALRARIDRTVLHGSIAGLTADEALASVLPTCGLASRRQGNRLIVSAAR